MLRVKSSKLWSLKTRSIVVTSVSVVTFAAVGWWLDVVQRDRLIAEKRDEVSHHTTPYANAIVVAFAQLTSKLDGLSVFVSLNTLGQIVDSMSFDTYASGLHAASPWVRTFQLVKDGIIRYSYPLAGNEKIIGVNLLKDPRPFIGRDVHRAIERNAPTITGPTDLIQGGYGLIIRQPVYDRNERLLGLVAVVIDLDGFLKRAGVTARPEEYRIALADTSDVIFYGEHTVQESSPVVIHVSLPDGHWRLLSMPAVGWEESVSAGRGAFRLNVLAIILLLGGIVYLVVSRQEQLSGLVRERTKELDTTIGLLETDIREREAAERSLRESELRFRTLAENAPVGIWLADPDGSVGYINPHLAEITGLSIESAHGTGWASRLHPDDRERVFAAWTRFVKGEVPYALTYRFQRADGEIRWVIGQAMPSRSNEGELMGFVGTLVDVTEQMRAEEALRASEEQYRQFFEDDLTGDFISSADGKILSCNPAFARIYGYGSVEEILKLDANVLYRSRHQREDFLERLREQGRIEYLESEYVRSDGSVVYTVETAVGIFDENGNLASIRGYIFDDTKRKLLEKQFLQAQKLESLGTLAGGIAHDFNNILGIIVGNASLMERLANNPESVVKRSEAILKAGTRGANLVKQLLTFARKTEVQFETVSLNDIVHEVCGMLTETFPKNIKTTMELDGSIPSVVVDATQIHQVLLNLCVNARDAMPKGGTLTISSTRVASASLRQKFDNPSAPEYVRIAVGDTGTGMDEQTRVRIFEPFFTTKDRGKGTGLGLSLVFGIMESHNGFVDVESVVGSGSTFALYFPVSGSIDEPSDIPRERIEDVPGGTETILFVEDEATLRELVEFVLSGKGYTVLTAGDGQEGIEMYRSRREEIHLVLSDLDLPRLSGFEVVKQLKEINPSVRIVLASGFVAPDAKNALLRAGIAEFVHKPFAVNELLKIVRLVLDQRS
ncbi:MAG: PAS domain S-box protein [Ignavibacteria bacterium]|nr:PAS domain S-box protein [Ignavibacteria bacterium]